MVVFIEGKSRKDLYRKFKIKTQQTPDDFQMIKEVLERRIKHKDEWELPDLILIDGGKAHLLTALKVLTKHQLKIKLLALAKRRNILYTLEKEFRAKDLKEELKRFLLWVRDSAHRFAISYHKHLRKKSLLN